MSHFAKVLNNKVIQVIVADAEFFENFADSSQGEWIQTSYNTHGNQNPNNASLRGNYAGIGYTYDREKDVFIPPKPYPSWFLNEDSWLWEAPAPLPENGIFVWNEQTLSWTSANQGQQ